MIIKLILIGLVLFMAFNLFKAMMIMLKNEPDSHPMSKYIGKRLLASAVIVTLIILAIMTGLITPNPRPY